MTIKKVQPQGFDRTPTQLIVGKDSFKSAVQERIELGEIILTRQNNTREQVEQSKRDFSNWDDYNYELLKQSFNNENNEYKNSYNKVNFYYEHRNKTEPFILKEKLEAKLNNLKQLIAKVDLMKSEIPDQVSPTKNNNLLNLDNSKDIFIVHGHNNEVKIDVARLLEKLGLNPIILHEQANEGKTIIEKFEAHSKVGFAIILLTDDDLGKNKNDLDLIIRARQNVILEMGYFIGKLGRNRVCPLYITGVELPSDLYGLLYVEIDNQENWKFKLVKELKAAGYDIDTNRIL